MAISVIFYKSFHQTAMEKEGTEINVKIGIYVYY